MNLQAGITLAIAVLGAALGIYNAINSYRDRAVRLKVTPKWAYAPDFKGMSIEVINLSAFPVTLTEVGITLGKPRTNLPKRLSIPNKAIMGSSELPLKLDRHSSASFAFKFPKEHALEMRRAYALTSSNHLATGTSDAFKQMVAEAV